MMNETDRIPLREALEQLLRDNARSKPGFVHRVMLDPKGTVEPMVASLVGDDGDLDLAGIDVQVHVATPGSLHLVLDTSDVQDDAADVVGFAFGQRTGGLDLRLPVARPKPLTALSADDCSGSDLSCHSNVDWTNYCGGCTG